MAKSWPRRMKYLLLALVGVVLALAAAFYLLVIKPHRDLRILSPDADPAVVRAVCHRVLRVPRYAHDAFIYLSRVGDESSVPRLLRALRSSPSAKGQLLECTWWHCRTALRAITNNNPGIDYEDWRKWYEANKHRSRLEWIADGFKAQGYDVSPAGSERSVRELLRVLGEHAWGAHAKTSWTPRNAGLLLQSYDQAALQAALKLAVKSGAVEEKRGAARYWLMIKDRTAEPLLRELLGDGDRSVRLCASATLAEFELDRLKNPPGYLVGRTATGLKPFRRGVLSGEGILYLPVLRDSVAAFDLRKHKEVWRFSADDGWGWGVSLVALDGEQLFFASARGTLFCVRREDGSVVWRRSLGEKREGYSHKAPVPCDRYLVVEVDVRDDPARRVCVHRKGDGQLLAQAEGRLQAVHGATVFVSRAGEMHLLSLPDLTPKMRLGIKHRALGMGTAGDLGWFVLTDTDGCSSSDKGKVWIEGWSLATGERSYSSPIHDGTLDWGSTAIQPRPGVAIVALGTMTCAINPGDGTFLWETAVGSHHCFGFGDFLTLEHYRTLRVLDAASGQLIAHYAPETSGCFHDNVYLLGQQMFAFCDGTLFAFAVPNSLQHGQPAPTVPHIPAPPEPRRLSGGGGRRL